MTKNKSQSNSKTATRNNQSVKGVDRKTKIQSYSLLAILILQSTLTLFISLKYKTSNGGAVVLPILASIELIITLVMAVHAEILKTVTKHKNTSNLATTGQAKFIGCLGILLIPYSLMLFGLTMLFYLLR
jgi:uncharacterized membrane protein